MMGVSSPDAFFGNFFVKSALPDLQNILLLKWFPQKLQDIMYRFSVHNIPYVYVGVRD
jgi:hypothetical protein